MTTTDVRCSAIEALAGRIFSTGVRAAELCTAYLGIHLGFYRSLADSPATPTALAERTGCDERYVREWLTALAVALARRAGYTDGQIVPIAHPVWRFYRLVP